MTDTMILAEAPTPAVTNEQLAGKVVEAVKAVQDAEETVVTEGKRLTAHMADPDAHGQDAGTCIGQSIEEHNVDEGAHVALKTVLESKIADKADMAKVNAALTLALAEKADVTALSLKADKSEVTAALALKADEANVQILTERVDSIEEGGGGGGGSGGGSTISVPEITGSHKAAIGHDATFTLHALSGLVGGKITKFAYAIDSGEPVLVDAENNCAPLLVSVPSDAIVGTNMKITVIAIDSFGGKSEKAEKIVSLVTPFIASPSLLFPSSDSSISLSRIVIATSLFQVAGDTDTHVASKYRITDADGLSVYDSGEDTTHLLSITLSTRDLAHLRSGAKYSIQAAHRGETLGWSEWGEGNTVVVNTDKVLVVSGVGGGIYSSSSDLETWTPTFRNTIDNMVTNISMFSKINDTYIAIDNNANVYTSKNLETWTGPKSITSSGYFVMAAHGDGKICIIDSRTGIVFTSTDGKVWSEAITFGTSASRSLIKFVKDQFFARVNDVWYRSPTAESGSWVAIQAFTDPSDNVAMKKVASICEYFDQRYFVVFAKGTDSRGYATDDFINYEKIVSFTTSSYSISDAIKNANYIAMLDTGFTHRLRDGLKTVDSVIVKDNTITETSLNDYYLLKSKGILITARTNSAGYLHRSTDGLYFRKYTNVFGYALSGMYSLVDDKFAWANYKSFAMTENPDVWEYVPEISKTYYPPFALDYMGGRFVGTSYRGILLSDDAENWKNVALPLNAGGVPSPPVVFKDHVYVHCYNSSGSQSFWKLTKDFEYIKEVVGGNTLTPIACSPTKMVAFSYENGLYSYPTQMSVRYTLDGEKWESGTSINSPSIPARTGLGFVNRAAYGNGKFFFLSHNLAYVSSDGSTFQSHALVQRTPEDNTGQAYRGLRFLNGLFIFFQNYTPSNVIWSTSDGVTFKTSHIIDDNYIYDITYCNGNYIATGQKGIHQSIDLELWSQIQSVSVPFHMITNNFSV